MTVYASKSAFLSGEHKADSTVTRRACELICNKTDKLKRIERNLESAIDEQHKRINEAKTLLTTGLRIPDSTMGIVTITEQYLNQLAEDRQRVFDTLTELCWLLNIEVQQLGWIFQHTGGK